jgi:hypothetical protein
MEDLMTTNYRSLFIPLKYASERHHCIAFRSVETSMTAKIHKRPTSSLAKVISPSEIFPDSQLNVIDL